ncbi:hypothetical protein GCM10018962_02750 [Dactylosporangium matsuzakiense]|uniref:Uncharacterized protein n=1 Tax=Dactylosporangium matsuzakiense TaxID=53360 RepID=A0A9W6KG79_9ACTN|nr:hypothetical protein GCM10017581_020470 [Dactylosporangium matsuzakiense]
MHGQEDGGEIFVGEPDRSATDEAAMRNEVLCDLLPQRRLGDAQLLGCLGVGVSTICHASPGCVDHVLRQRYGGKAPVLTATEQETRGHTSQRQSNSVGSP